MRRIFGKPIKMPRHGPIMMRLSKKQTAVLNAGLRSKTQFLTASGWK